MDLRKSMAAMVIALACAAKIRAQADEKLLLRTPSLSATKIAFCFGGDVWMDDRDGGEARRLAGSKGTSSGPIFSPAGTKVAYTSRMDGNTDVYFVDAAG